MSSEVVKQELLAKLKQEHCFWSYNENSIKDIPDDMLIEKTLLHLDLDEISQLFLIYPFKKIKQVWLDYLVPQGEYLYTLNRFFAWYYFKVKKPDAYIKSMATHRLNKMFVWEHTLQTFEAVSKPIQNFLNNNLIMVNLTNGTVFT